MGPSTGTAGTKLKCVDFYFGLEEGGVGIESFFYFFAWPLIKDK